MNVMIARKKMKLTQDEVCERVGISRCYLSKIENGQDRTVSKELMIRIAKELNSDVQTLFFSEE